LDLIQSNEDANKVVETTLYTLDSIKLKNPVIIGTISFKNTAAADEAPNYEKYQINIK
jgi:hypothetical protein